MTSWDFTEHIKEIFSKLEIDAQDLSVDWSAKKVTFRNYEGFHLGELMELSTIFDTRDIIVRPRFNYNGAWSEVVVMLSPSYFSNP